MSEIELFQSTEAEISLGIENPSIALSCIGHLILLLYFVYSIRFVEMSCLELQEVRFNNQRVPVHI